jgi:hypothetical protein
MNVELRSSRRQWTWVVWEGNVATVGGQRFSSPEEALRDARADGPSSPSSDDDPPPLVA